MHVWPGDERFVPTADRESNWGTARREWLDRPDGPPVPASNLHPVPVDEALAGGHDPAWAAARYAAEVESRLPRRHGLPAFDVILLGVGTDGHILSAFPRSDPVLATSGTATAVEAPTHIGPHLPRVTLVPRLLEAAGLILVMVPGMGKRESVRACFGPEFDPDTLPGAARDPAERGLVARPGLRCRVAHRRAGRVARRREARPGGAMSPSGRLPRAVFVESAHRATGRDAPAVPAAGSRNVPSGRPDAPCS